MRVEAAAGDASFGVTTTAAEGDSYGTLRTTHKPPPPPQGCGPRGSKEPQLFAENIYHKYSPRILAPSLRPFRAGARVAEQPDRPSQITKPQGMRIEAAAGDASLSVTTTAAEGDYYGTLRTTRKPPPPPQDRSVEFRLCRLCSSADERVDLCALGKQNIRNSKTD